MKHTGYQRFFQKADILNSWDAFLRRMSRKPYRRRDDCPKWVKADAIEKAQQKREMRVMAQSKKDAEDIAASRTGWEWIIDAIELN